MMRRLLPHDLSGSMNAAADGGRGAPQHIGNALNICITHEKTVKSLKKEIYKDSYYFSATNAFS
jgi:hypothetical protein